MTKLKFIVPLFIIIFYLTGCNVGYEVKDGKVFYNTWNEGSGSLHTLIRGADSKTLTMLKHTSYAKDKNYAYYKGKIIKGADPETFESILDYYSKDFHYAFYQDKLLDNSDANSFEVMDGSPYSKDKSDYYYNAYKIDVSDYKSFKILDDSWSKDKSFYYVPAGSIVHKYPLTDYDSFELLKEGYAKDKSRVYYFGDIVDKADSRTFDVIGFAEGKDKNYCFRSNKISACK